MKVATVGKKGAKRLTMDKLHGFKRGEEVIHITHLPNLKKPVLLVGNAYRVRKIASFDSEEDAECFCSTLEKWLQTRGGNE